MKLIGKAHVLLWMLLAGNCLTAQDPGTQIEIVPNPATVNDTIAFKLSGVWSSGCIPQSPQLSFSATTIRIDTSNQGKICTAAMTPWSLSGTFGKLAAGEYQVIAYFSGPSVPSTFEIGRKSFIVYATAPLNELVLPVVVNGAVEPKLHYQTIFTILNASEEERRPTLQVYGNGGKPTGVFCSPLAPPPSSVTPTLRSSSESVNFTSADLPFLNGWALVRWEGSDLLQVSAEVTMVAATPSPCLLICNRPSTEKLSSVQISAVKPARDFRLPVTINRYRQTALALVNPSTVDTVRIKVTLLDASGESPKLGVPDSFEISIGPLERVSKFLWQMALEQLAITVIIPPPEQFQGSVRLTSTGLFAVGALNIMFPEGKFVAVPVFTTPP